MLGLPFERQREMLSDTGLPMEGKLAGEEGPTQPQGVSFLERTPHAVPTAVVDLVADSNGHQVQ